MSGENITRSGKGKRSKEEEVGMNGGRTDELGGDVMEERRVWGKILIGEGGE